MAELFHRSGGWSHVP